MSAFGSCPTPARERERVLLGHGSGGRLSAELIAEVFLPAFANPALSPLEDQARVAGADRLAVTTDAFVVSPLFFPGGDIGTLAVCGTVNDLAVGGAEPEYLTASFVLEEGLAIDDLRRVVESMRACCEDAGVGLIAGDTKVVERGKADGMFITTTGIGRFRSEPRLSVSAARPGDAVLVSGTLGDHGVVILTARDGLGLEAPLASDCAPLGDLCRAVIQAAPGLRCMRDPTRGGVSATLAEIAAASGVGVRLREADLPIRPAVRGACELLGLDPLYVANEGKVVAVVPEAEAEAALEAMRGHPDGRDAAVIGEIVEDGGFSVVLESVIGGERIVPQLQGEQLPRIC